MHYESNLQFFQKLLKNLGIPVRIFTDLQDDFIESTLYGSYSNIINMTLKERQEMLLKVCKPNCFLRIYDPFLCNYIIFQLPDTEPTTFVTVVIQNPQHLLPLGHIPKHLFLRKIF